MSEGSVYFGGKSESSPVWMAEPDWLRTEEAFLQYVGTVWVNENAVVTDEESLRQFDFHSLKPGFSRFLADGGVLPRRGQRIDELWLSNQLVLSTPIRCVVNEARKSKDLERITRLKVTNARAIWDEACDFLNSPSQPGFVSDHRLKPFLMLVKDNFRIAHVVVCWTIIDGVMHFADPWPDVSLLCEGENDAGVKARESTVVEHAWTITRAEFERVIYAILLLDLGDIPRPALVEVSEQDYTGVNPELLRKAAQLAAALNSTRKSTMPLEGFRPITRAAVACCTNNIGLLKEAINDGDDLDERDTDFNTPLHFAAERGHLELVQLLVSHFADYSIKNGNDQTAAEVADANGHHAVAAFLQSLPPYGSTK